MQKLSRPTGVTVLAVLCIIAAIAFLLGGAGALIGIVGVVFGLIVIIGGVMLYQNAASHTVWGVIILILAIIDFPGVWGFGIGSLLAFIGAILALVYKPAMGPSMMPGQPMGSMPMGSMSSMATSPPMGQMGMTCKNCGASIPAGAARCPSCGASVM